LDNILSADCFRLRDAKTKEVRRCYLASIKCPKSVPRSVRGEAIDEPYAFEAKEFVREQIIGKPLSITWEYDRQPMLNEAERKANKKPETLYYVSVTYDNNKNLSEELVKKGFADIVPHAKTDERAPNFLKLHTLYQQAKTQGVGKHNTQTKYQKPEIIDITYNRPKHNETQAAQLNRERVKLGHANALLKDLGISGNYFDPRAARKWTKRERDQNDLKKPWVPCSKMKCVVEWMFTPSRLKVRLLNPPQTKGRRKQYNIILCLSGLKSQSRTDSPGPNAKRAYMDAEAKIKELCHQKEAWVEIEYLDAFSNFYGSLLDNSKKFHLSSELVKMGACEVNPYARRATNRETLMKYQKS